MRAEEKGEGYEGAFGGLVPGRAASNKVGS